MPQGGDGQLSQDDQTPFVRAGDKAVPPTVRRVQPAKALDEPDHIRESLEAGRTYRVVEKWGSAFRAQAPEVGAGDVVKVGIVGELAYTRLVESNDGRRVTEVRTIDRARVIVHGTGAGDFTVDCGPPDRTIATSS